MVLSILIATIVAPGLLGSQEAIRQSQSKEKKEEHRARRCNLVATCVKSSHRSREINGRQVVLRNGKLWIDTGTEDGSPLGHPYAGYYLPYPDTSYEGLVTTITDVAPVMNWVYIDKETGEVKYGVRADAQPNLTGPFDCTRQDRRLTFDGWEGWCTVEEAPGLWGLYFDLSDDGLKSRVAPGTRVLEVELSRKEKRWKKDGGERMADQTTQRAVDGEGEVVVERPLGGEVMVERPGVGGEGVGREQEGRRMKIPESIFEDPPKVVEGLVFRARTPPPAYSPAVGADGEGLGSSEGREEASAESSDMRQSSSPAIQTSPLPVISKQSSLGKETQSSSNKPTSPQTQPLPTLINDNGSTPKNTDSPPSKPSKPSKPQSTPLSDKRTPPRLNRSSNSRALAQAQKFEALAAAQDLNNAQARSRSSARGSRTNSNTSSVYSNEGTSLSAPGPSIQSQASPTPAPLALAVSKAKQAMALAARPRSMGMPKSVANSSGRRPVTPPRQRAPSIREDPAVSEARSTGDIGPVVSLARRPSLSRATVSPRSSASRSSPQQSVQRPGLDRRQRDRAASDLSSSSRSRGGTSRSSPGQSLARTMTSGKRNQGMSNRIGGGRGSGDGVSRQRGRERAAMNTGGRERDAVTGGRKTTSALFREIDDLVSLEGEIGSSKVGRRGGES